VSSEWQRIQQIEREVIQPFLEEIPVRIATMAKALGIDVKSASLPPRISGQLQRLTGNESGFRIRVSRHEAPSRQRFTIAHEIAHYLLHRDHIGDGIEDTILYRSTLSDAREAEANRLAAELLMPAVKIRESLNELNLARTAASAKVLAEKFEVSEAAMSIRLGLT
jgi:IrrE N-terminal-like domain